MEDAAFLFLIAVQQKGAGLRQGIAGFDHSLTVPDADARVGVELHGRLSIGFRSQFITPSLAADPGGIIDEMTRGVAVSGNDFLVKPFVVLILYRLDKLYPKIMSKLKEREARGEM